MQLHQRVLELATLKFHLLLGNLFDSMLQIDSIFSLITFVKEHRHIRRPELYLRRPGIILRTKRQLGNWTHYLSSLILRRGRWYQLQNGLLSHSP